MNYLNSIKYNQILSILAIMSIESRVDNGFKLLPFWLNVAMQKPKRKLWRIWVIMWYSLPFEIDWIGLNSDCDLNIEEENKLLLVIRDNILFPSNYYCPNSEGVFKDSLG